MRAVRPPEPRRSALLRGLRHSPRQAGRRWRDAAVRCTACGALARRPATGPCQRGTHTENGGLTRTPSPAAARRPSVRPITGRDGSRLPAVQHAERPRGALLHDLRGGPGRLPPACNPPTARRHHDLRPLPRHEPAGPPLLPVLRRAARRSAGSTSPARRPTASAGALGRTAVGTPGRHRAGRHTRHGIRDCRSGIGYRPRGRKHPAAYRSLRLAPSLTDLPAKRPVFCAGPGIGQRSICAASGP